jgi:RimJ/RimL family protein N-acetyltransferase
MTEILRTQRLYLRELQNSDAAFIQELVNTPGWLQYIGDRQVHNPDDAIRYLQNGPLKSYQMNGFGLWCICLQTNHTPIGLCGLIRREGLEHVDIGYALLPAFTGQQYAFEAAAAVFNYGLNTLQLPVLQAITLPDNGPSVRLLEKLGMRYEKTIQLPGDGVDLLLYTSV